MLGKLAKSAVVGFVQKKAGVSPIGTIPAMLLTSGASLLLTRGRRPVGLAVVALGGLMIWREIEKAQEEASSEQALPAACDASAARARR